MAVSLELFEEYEKKEKCGVFGVWGTPDASQLVYQGLFAQKHRGQESAGMAVSDGVSLNGHTGMGLVSQIFNTRMLKEDLAGTSATPRRGPASCATPSRSCSGSAWGRWPWRTTAT